MIPSNKTLGNEIIHSTGNRYPKSWAHKRLGSYYLLASLWFGLCGSLVSIILRLELESSGNRLITLENRNFYNLSITLHGLLMIFFLVMPGLFGSFGNILVPLYLGAPEVTYPRINNMSVLLIPLSYSLILLTMNSEFASGVGWTLYPPLSTAIMNLSPLGMSLIINGLLLSGMSSSLTSLNFFITLNIMRSCGLTLSNITVYVWSIGITASMLLVVLPILSGALVMLTWDIHYNTTFFDPLFGGDPVFYQHLFWFFGHPEVYILVLPAFGSISSVVSGIVQLVLFGNISMILAMSCISLLGSIVWAHHMFTVGLISDTRAYFMSVTMIISIPTGSKIFNWLSTYLGSNAIFIMISTSAVFFVPIFLVMFTIGGSTGVILGSMIVDIGLHDTYYVVTHFHFVLSLGTVIAILTITSFLQDYLLSVPSYVLVYTSIISRKTVLHPTRDKKTSNAKLRHHKKVIHDPFNHLWIRVCMSSNKETLSFQDHVLTDNNNKLKYEMTINNNTSITIWSYNNSVTTDNNNISSQNARQVIVELSLHSITSSLIRYYLIVNFVGITSTFIPMHFLGFNVMPRRIPDFPDYVNCWNSMSSLGSGITLISFFLVVHLRVVGLRDDMLGRGFNRSICRTALIKRAVSGSNRWQRLTALPSNR